MPNNEYYAKQCCTPTTTWKMRAKLYSEPCFTIVKGDVEVNPLFLEGACILDFDCDGRPDACTEEYVWEP